MKDIPMTDFEAERQYEEACLLNEALEDVKEGRVLDGKEALSQLKEKYNLSNDDNSLVYDTYIKSCRYIHGGKVLKETLKLDIENLKENSSDKMIDSFEAVEKLLKTLDKLLMKNHLILILIERDFHRKRRLIEILLGKEIYNIFSENLKEV